MSRESTRKTRIRTLVVGVAIGAMVAAAVPVLADVGDAVLQGRFNSVDQRTALSGEVAGTSTLKVANAAVDGTGITIQVASGQPPLVVNSAKRVKRLNADKLDGLSSEDFIKLSDLAPAPSLVYGHIEAENDTVDEIIPAGVVVTDLVISTREDAVQYSMFDGTGNLIRFRSIQAGETRQFSLGSGVVSDGTLTVRILAEADGDGTLMWTGYELP